MQRSPKALDHRWDIGPIYFHKCLDLGSQETGVRALGGHCSLSLFQFTRCLPEGDAARGGSGSPCEYWDDEDDLIYLVLLLNYIISIYLQETHFWTLCSNYYCGGLKLEVAATADPKYVVQYIIC